MLRLADFEFKLFPARIEFGWPDPVEMKDRYLADRELLWVPQKYYEMIDELKGSKPAIVFMGDSCTAWGIYDRLFDSIIDQVHKNNDFEFVNAGVGGWSSYQGTDIFILDAKANPVVSPTIVDRDDARLHRQHVALQLSHALV